MIRLITLVSIGMVILLQISCTPEQPDFLFESDYLLVKSEPIAAGQSPLLTYFWSESNIKSKIEGQLGEHGLKFEDIQQIRTAVANLRVRNLDGDLGTLGEVIMRISDASNPNLKLEAAYTIYLDEKQKTEINLVPSLTNLLDVMSGDRFNIELQLRFRRVNATPLDVELFVKFGVVE